MFTYPSAAARAANSSIAGSDRIGGYDLGQNHPRLNSLGDELAQNSRRQK
jgi:hypothetical protein